MLLLILSSVCGLQFITVLNHFWVCMRLGCNRNVDATMCTAPLLLSVKAQEKARPCYVEPPRPSTTVSGTSQAQDSRKKTRK